MKNVKALEVVVKDFFHVLIMSRFPNFVLSNTSLFKKGKKKSPQTNMPGASQFPSCRNILRYSLCFYDNLPSKNSCFRITNSTSLQAGSSHHIYEGNHD